MPFIIAHGLTGIFDEALYFGVAVIFTIFMGISWWRSRSFEPELEEESQQDEQTERTE